MPPVNSPIATSPPRIPSPYPFHSQESPPLSSSPYWTSQDTLAQTHDPRYQYPMPSSSRRTSTPPPPHPSDLSRRERLQRVLARLNRAHEPPSAPSAYGNRTPSPNRQGLYDWAPVPLSGAAGASTEDHEMRRAEEELYRELTGDEMTEGQQDAAERRLWQRRLMEERARERRRRVVARESGNGESGLGQGEGSRTERMLRYVMQRERSGVSEEEERARGAGWWRPTPGGYEGSGLSTHEGSGQVRQENFAAFRRGYLAENLPPRLPRISTPVVSSSTGGKGKSEHALLENALVYLSRLRDCQTYGEALEAAVDNNLATKEWWADKHDDFVVDINSIEPLEPSHWLQPGAIFDGHQHASTSSMEIAHRPPSATHVAVEQINPNYRHSSTSDPTARSNQPLPFDASRPWLSHTIPSAPNLRQMSTKFLDPSHDHWPVRVTLHSVDWESMTLQGTMEAYDVPQHPASLLAARNASMHARPRAGKKHAPITTLMEGHILDHRAHSFLTPPPDEHRSYRGGPTTTNAFNSTPYTLPPKDPLTFPFATPNLDAQNWLALPPFRTPPSLLNTSFSPSEAMARTILSPRKINALSRDYIHMRWKERYFIHPRDGPSCSDEALGDRDRGHGLTISGFYYVSLRRSDGKVEGLYFDPRSRPYQVVRLQGKGRGGVWELA